jgi:small subunit ribosomal protein S17e
LGKVKTEQIKRLAKELIKRFPEQFSTSFDDNKHVVSALTLGATTRVRNQVSGYITRTYALAQADSSGDEVLEEGTE